MSVRTNPLPSCRAMIVLIAAMLPLASCAMIMGYPKAEVDIVSVDPNSPSTTYKVQASDGDGPTAEGVKALALGEYESASTQFEAAVQATPKDANALFLAGLAKELLGDLAVAQQHYKAAFGLKQDQRYLDSHNRVRDSQ